MAGEVARRGRALTGILLLVIAALAATVWWQHSRVNQAERQEGLDATRMVAEVFRGKRDLRVGQLSGVVIARSQYDGRIFHPTQLTRAPATVNYLLPLQRIGAGDLRWDADRRIMTVRIPDVTVEAPAVDMGRAQILDQKGIWIGREAGSALQKQAAERIATRAGERARAPENMARARRTAIEGIDAMVRQPLVAAGVQPAEVRVLFPWKGGRSDEQWDRSRSAAEVVGGSR